MQIDAIIIARNENVILKSVPGYIYFRNNYSKYFRDSSNNIFVRYRSKNFLGTWRLVPNRSTNFYCCEKVDSDTLIILDDTFRSKYADVKK